MQLRVLGCSGGIGTNLRTTSLLIDEDILIDCGTGAGDLSMEELTKIRHIFLTHSHLDHIATLPFLVDTLFDQLQQQPVVLHCQVETFNALKAHIFNWAIWPDFFELPSKADPVIRFSSLQPGETCKLGERSITSVRVNHVVPGVGYCISDSTSTLAFSGDTTTNDRFWELLNRQAQLDLLIIECAFSEQDRELSKIAKHYCPSLLAEDMAKLHRQPKICISHLKAGEEAIIFKQICEALPHVDLVRLCGGEVFQL